MHGPMGASRQPLNRAGQSADAPILPSARCGACEYGRGSVHAGWLLGAGTLRAPACLLIRA